MRTKLPAIIILLGIIFIYSCRQKDNISEMKIIFLHHSTGGVIWRGGKTPFTTKVIRRISTKYADLIGAKVLLPKLFDEYNKKRNKNYLINEMTFPKTSPYGWNNYPYDYYNIWVKNAGGKTFLEEPTLEILTKEYQVIIFKHCYPVSNIEADQDSADINSSIKSISNYKLQYLALREKLHEFPETKFILFTGAVQLKTGITEDEAIRTREFFRWVKDEWDLPDDNIYLWDLYQLETEGMLFMKEEFAVSANDPHPNDEFASLAANLLFKRVIDVIENNGTKTELTGYEKKQ